MWEPGFDRIFGRTDARLAVLEETPVGPSLAAGLHALRTVQMDAYAAVRVHALWNKVIAWATAQQMIATNDSVSGLRGSFGPPPDLDEPYVVAAQEIACATSVSYSAARQQVELVDRVGHCMPASWVALDRGDLSLAHIRSLHRITRDCTPKVAEAVDQRIIPQAVTRGWTPSELARAARKLIVALDPDGAAEREEAAKERSDVEFFPGADGMASLTAFGPAPLTRELVDVIDERAAAMGRAGDHRPIGVRRFQAMYDAVMGSADQAAAAPRSHTVVTIDLMTLLGLNDKPGELMGYGPISAQMARDIAADSTLSRLVLDPVTGEGLDLGRTYKPSRRLRDLIRLTRPRCSMIGCSRPAYQCEIDHRDAHGNGGDTNPENLQPLCKLHHQLKTKKLWKVGVNADGQQTWTSFLGFTYVSHDQDPLVSDSDPPAEAA
jgi:hypothetical protein